MRIMKKEQHRVANLEQGSQTQPGWFFRLARLLTFLLGAALSLMAIYTFVANAQIIIHDPGLVLPESTWWTAAQLESALAGLGLPGNFYAVYSLGIALVWSLTFMACGWLILLRRSQDWFGLYLALLLLGWTNGVGVLVSTPDIAPWVQELNSYLNWLIWPSLFLLFYIFPNGQVTPRWARWFAWGLGLFTAYGLVTTFLEIPPTSFLFVMPLIFAVMIVGGYTQVYRYRHAGALERQQIKWVVLALVLFITGYVITGMLLNLSGLGDPRQSGLTNALIFQIIIITIYNLTFIGIPVAIVVSMLRYRLWDIDVDHPQNVGLRGADRHAGAGLLRRGDSAAAGFRRDHRDGKLAGRDRDLHPADRRPVQPTAPAHPGFHRPALLPPEVQRRAGPGGFRRQRAQRDRLRGAEQQAGGGGQSDDAA